MLTNILLALCLVILIILLIIVLRIARKQNKQDAITDTKYRLDSIATEINRIEATVKHEITQNRTEHNNTSRQAREELGNALQRFSEMMAASQKEISGLQKNQLEIFSENIRTLTRSVEERLNLLRETLEKKIADMQTGNEKKLEDMRQTVDEKLQKTLETRLGESFKLVSERLEAVHKGLGDMQQLATGVGDLKKVLTNVKSRGVLGEYQLEGLLEQLLTPDQYAKNVKTKPGSSAMVEFAIKLPGRDKTGAPVWMPIDSKFPKEDFELLHEAYEHGNAESIEQQRAAFVKGIKKCAADIYQKYIDPPNTTDFAILFLPFESLYAEVLRTPGLFETLQREYRIIITGPTTLSALLSSLQMGFRTLAIERRSSEVWELLGAVKTEFSTFGGILDKTQKKLQEASNVIEQAGRRTRAIERKLKNVQELPDENASSIINDAIEKTIAPKELDSDGEED